MGADAPQRAKRPAAFEASRLVARFSARRNCERPDRSQSRKSFQLRDAVVGEGTTFGRGFHYRRSAARPPPPVGSVVPAGIRRAFPLKYEMLYLPPSTHRLDPSYFLDRKTGQSPADPSDRFQVQAPPESNLRANCTFAQNGCSTRPSANWVIWSTGLTTFANRYRGHRPWRPKFAGRATLLPLFANRDRPFSGPWSQLPSMVFVEIYPSG